MLSCGSSNMNHCFHACERVSSEKKEIKSQKQKEKEKIRAIPIKVLLKLSKIHYRGQRYNCIKQITCVENAIPSQVVTMRTLTKKTGNGASMLMSVCTKIAWQMNCKMGGALWNVNIPLKDTVILGYDTFHDTVNKKRSVF